MDVAWGDAAVDRTAGVDIAGIRGLDQQMEALFVNGITTVTLRGRYLTILTWAIGEFFSAEADAGETSYSPDRFSTFLRRIEFLVLACSTVEGGGGAPGGAIGTQMFQPQMAALVAGGTVPFPEHGGGTMLGTYFGLCRALGLLAYAGQGVPVPFALTPRGRATWDVRRRALADVGWRAVVSSDGVGSDEARALAPHFSLRSLDPATGEAEALRDALLQPWRPDDATAAQVEAAYGRFAQTVNWLRAGGGDPRRVDVLLATAWRRAVTGVEGAAIDLTWAEYEWRCRLHYSIELMLSAVSSAVHERREATLTELIDDWLAQADVPARLAAAWPEAASAGFASGADARASVPLDLWLAGLPGDLDSLPSHARALAAFALASALAAQSAALRSSERFMDRRSIGERALACVEAAGAAPFADTLRSLARIAVEAHFATTFRKMGGGQKCSLRFFPEGAKLLTTRAATPAGRSGSRLWNMVRVLEDAGVPGLGVRA